MGTPIWKGYTALVEQPQSRGFEIGDVTRKIGIWVGTYDDCVAALPVKGLFGSDAFAGWIVDGASLAPDRGERARLTVRYVNSIGSGRPLPEDHWRLEGVEDNPRIERNPKYSSLTAQHLEGVQTAVQGKDDTIRDAAYTALTTLGKELVDKMRRGQESYYAAVRRYVWTTSSYTPPIAVDGGTIGTPGGPGAAYLNPTYQWLRFADDVDYANGVYKITSTWLGGPNGHWDSDIYS